MKRLISALTLCVLLISLCACKRPPDSLDGDSAAAADIAVQKDSDETAQVEATEKRDTKPQSTAETDKEHMTEDVPQDKPEPEPDPQPQPYSLKYTLLHNKDFSIWDNKTFQDMADTQTVCKIMSAQELLQLNDMPTMYHYFYPSFAQITPVHVRTETEPFDYNVPRQKIVPTKRYDDTYFEDRILLVVVLKVAVNRTAADISEVKSDGTIQVDLYIPKSQNDICSDYFCDFIELNREYADIDFKLSFNEIYVDEPVETRAPLPEYPDSVDFKAKQFGVSPCNDYTLEYEECKRKHTVIISSTQELENYRQTVFKNHQSIFDENDTKQAYFHEKNKRIDFTLNPPAYENEPVFSRKKTIPFNPFEYYNEEFFEDKIICAVIESSSGSVTNQVSSVSEDGKIIIESYYSYSNVITCVTKSYCEFIELDKKYANTEFKIEHVNLNREDYIWNE